jgi:DNA modification methylase
MVLHNELQMEYVHPGKLQDYRRQLRSLPESQVTKASNIITECGFVVPIVIGKDNVIIVGQPFVQAARNMNLDSIPVIRVEHLDENQERILRLAHDRITEEAEWNKESLAAELNELRLVIPDLTITGFNDDEISLTLDILPDNEPGDDIPELADGAAVVQKGDLFQLGEHRIYCGSALEEESYETLLGDEKVQMCFTDAPYNVKIDGHVGNSGKVQHDEFAMASGEMNTGEFTEFLAAVHKIMAKFSKDGAIIFSCMDWRHIPEITAAASAAGLTMLNLCVWAKNNGGMGSLYRSRHELVFVFKNGNSKHINNVELGKNGRYRTNVWEYDGVNSFGSRQDELKMHPTVKPLAMVMDAIKDCSRRGGIILDPFGGSGTTLIAAEKTERKARLIEIEPHYCDVTIRRWQELTGKDAIHVASGKTFNEIAGQGGDDHE